VELQENPRGRAPPMSFNRLGPFYRLQRRFGLLTDTDLAAGRRALLYVAVAWLAVLALAAAQGFALNEHHERAVLFDFSAYAYAIAIFAFVLMEQASETRMAGLISQFNAQGIIPETSRARFVDVRQRMERRTGSSVVEASVFVAAYVVAYASIARAAERVEGGTWFAAVVDGSLQLTFAGWWTLLIALPLFWFLLGRWLWRFVTWGLLLRDVARCNLRLVATHADRCGGLAFIAQYPNTYLLFVFALSTVVAATVLKHVMYSGAELMSFKYALIGLIAFLAIAFVVPLTAFVPVLSALKRDGLRRYSVLVTTHNLAFEAKWIDDAHRSPNEQPLGSPDVSSLADLAASYDMIKNIRPLPVTKETLIPLVLAAVLPFIGVALTQAPLKQIMGEVKALLFL
jgi:hypothetical protein